MTLAYALIDTKNSMPVAYFTTTRIIIPSLQISYSQAEKLKMDYNNPLTKIKLTCELKGVPVEENFLIVKVHIHDTVFVNDSPQHL